MSSSFGSAAGVGAALSMLSVLGSCASVDETRRAAIEAAWRGQASADVHENGAPVPWKVGQWVLLRVDEGGARSLLMITVRQRDGSAWWLGLDEIWPQREMRTLVLVDGYRPDAPGALKVRTIRARRPEGDYVDIAGDYSGSPGAGAIRARVEEILDAVRHRGVTEHPRDVSVPAGTFLGAWARPIYSRRGGDIFGGCVWYTNAVPIVGLAKAELRRPWLEFLYRTKMTELVAFGDRPEGPEIRASTEPSDGDAAAAGAVAGERQLAGR